MSGRHGNVNIGSHLSNCHYGIACLQCEVRNFTGLRYKCLRCRSHNLCAACYNQYYGHRPEPGHVMQCIMTIQDFELFYAKENLSRQYSCHSYACPYCGSLGFTIPTLTNHLLMEDFYELRNERPRPSVICPICCTKTIENNVFVSNLLKHIMESHRYEQRTQHPEASTSAAAAEAIVPTTSASASTPPFEFIDFPQRVAQMTTTTTPTIAPIRTIQSSATASPNPGRLYRYMDMSVSNMEQRLRDMMSRRRTMGSNPVIRYSDVQTYPFSNSAFSSPITVQSFSNPVFATIPAVSSFEQGSTPRVVSVPEPDSTVDIPPTEIIEIDDSPEPHSHE